MTIASDRWIRERCLGTRMFEMFYDDVRKGVFGFDTLQFDTHFDQNKLSSMKDGEEYCVLVNETNVKVKAITQFPNENNKPLISPFIGECRKTIEAKDDNGIIHTVKCPSYGLSSYGYDIRVDRKFKVFESIPDLLWRMRTDGTMIKSRDANVGHFTSENVVQTVDLPGMSKERYIHDIENDYIDIPPAAFILGVSTERVCMPKNVTATCMAKSTLARMGLIAMVTPIEAGWEGYITLEIVNVSSTVIRLYAGIGIMQLLFHVSNEDCMVGYADRAGKYQNQPAIPVPGCF